MALLIKPSTLKPTRLSLSRKSGTLSIKVVWIQLFSEKEPFFTRWMIITLLSKCDLKIRLIETFIDDGKAYLVFPYFKMNLREFIKFQYMGKVPLDTVRVFFFLIIENHEGTFFRLESCSQCKIYAQGYKNGKYSCRFLLKWSKKIYSETCRLGSIKKIRRLWQSKIYRLCDTKSISPTWITFSIEQILINCRYLVDGLLILRTIVQLKNVSSRLS